MIEVGKDMGPGGIECQNIVREALSLLVQPIDLGMWLSLDAFLGGHHLL